MDYKKQNISNFENIQNWKAWVLAAGHFEEYYQKLSKIESDDAHICNIWPKYFMYVLSMLKFGIVFSIFWKIDKTTLGKKYHNHFPDPSTEI